MNMRLVIIALDTISMWILAWGAIAFSLATVQTYLTIAVLISTLIFTALRIYMILKSGINKKESKDAE